MADQTASTAPNTHPPAWHTTPLQYGSTGWTRTAHDTWTTHILLTGPNGERYYLELDPAHTETLRRDLASGPGNCTCDLTAATDDEPPQQPAEDCPGHGVEAPQPAGVALPYTYTDDDSAQLTISAVNASTRYGDQPVIAVHNSEHQGDDIACVYVRPDGIEQVIAALRAAHRDALVIGECPQCDNTGACNGGLCPLIQQAGETQQTGGGR